MIIIIIIGRCVFSIIYQAHASFPCYTHDASWLSTSTIRVIVLGHRISHRVDLYTSGGFPELPHVSCVSEEKTVEDSRGYFTLDHVFNASMKPMSYGMMWISGQRKSLRRGWGGEGRMLLHQNSFFLHRYSFTLIDPLTLFTCHMLIDTQANGV